MLIEVVALIYSNSLLISLLVLHYQPKGDSKKEVRNLKFSITHCMFDPLYAIVSVWSTIGHGLRFLTVMTVRPANICVLAAAKKLTCLNQVSFFGNSFDLSNPDVKKS